MNMDLSPEAATLAADFVKRNAAEISFLGKSLLKGASDKVKLMLPNTYEKYLGSEPNLTY